MNFAAGELLLVELAAANFEDDVRGGSSNGSRGCGRYYGVSGQGKDGFIVGEGDRNGVDFATGNFYFFCSAGLGIFDGIFGGFRGAGADGGFVPVIGDVGVVRVKIPTLRQAQGRLSRRRREKWGTRCVFSARHVILNFDFGGRVGVAVGFRVDQGQRDFGHAGGLAVAGAGEDNVFHASAAQGLGGLLAEHPRDGVGDVGLAAAVGADDGRHTVSVELEFGAVTKRLEPENLKPLQFEQRGLLKNSGR